MRLLDLDSFPCCELAKLVVFEKKCLSVLDTAAPTRRKFLLSSNKRAVSVLFDEEEFSRLVRTAAELTLSEGRRVSIAELVRRATLSQFGEPVSAGKPRKKSGRRA